MTATSSTLKASPNTRIAEWSAFAVEELDRQGWGTLPELADSGWIESVLREAQEWRPTRVHTGPSWLYGSYESRDVPVGSQLGTLLAGPEAATLARMACRQPLHAPVRVELWMHRYVEGEILAPHRDVSGNVQLALSLRQPPEECGGNLFLKLSSGSLRLPIRPGTAVLFRAREIEHFSDRVLSTPAAPDPEKIVAVARYHFD